MKVFTHRKTSVADDGERRAGFYLTLSGKGKGDMKAIRHQFRIPPNLWNLSNSPLWGRKWSRTLEQSWYVAWKQVSVLLSLHLCEGVIISMCILLHKHVHQQTKSIQMNFSHPVGTKVLENVSFMLEVNFSTSWRSLSSDQETFKTLGVCACVFVWERGWGGGREREEVCVVSYVRNSCNTFSYSALICI